MMKFDNKDFIGPTDFGSDKIPELSAVYVIVENGSIVYCGIATNLKRRLPLIRVKNILSNLDGVTVWYWPFEQSQSDEARLLERHIQINNKPKYNRAQPEYRSDREISRSYLKAKYGPLRYWLAFNKASVTQILILIGSITGIFAVLLLFSDRFAFNLAEIFPATQGKFSFLSFFALSTAVASFALAYLQSGGNAESSSSLLKEIAAIRKSNIRMNEDLIQMKDEISNRISDDASPENVEYLSDSERENLAELIAEKASGEAIQEVFSLEMVKLKANFEKESEAEKLRLASESILNRMRREIDDLRLRANINLVIGMVITAGGLYLLWSTVSIIDSSQLLKTLANEDSSADGRFYKNLMLPLLPRIMIVVFVEIFAYFFLQLYKSGLAEIKYFQNEVTNVESRILAVEFACITGRHDSLRISFENLAKTERNFVLNKGQTTIEIEKSRLASQTSKELLKLVPSIFSSKS